MSPGRARRLVLGAPLAAAVCALAGCAADPGPATPAEGSIDRVERLAHGDPMARLGALSAEEDAGAGLGRAGAPPPELLSIPIDPARMRSPLDAIGGALPEPPAPPPTRAPSTTAEQRAEADALRRRAGGAPDADRWNILRQALELDPTSREIRLAALDEAARTGRESAAFEIARDASGHDPLDAVAAAEYALGLARLGQEPGATVAALIDSPVIRGDAADARSALARLELGSALIGSGYLQAGLAWLDAGLGLLGQLDPDSERALRLLSLEPANLALRGDAAWALGDPADAIASYERAATLEPGLPGLTARLDSIRSAGGRPASVALGILTRHASTDQPLSAEDRATLAGITEEEPEIRETVVGAILDLIERSRSSDTDARTVRGTLALAASAVSPEDAGEILFRVIAEDGPMQPLARAFTADRTAGALVEAGTRLTSLRPGDADGIARLIGAGPVQVRTLIERLAARPGPDAGVLLAALAIRRDDPGLAFEAASSVFGDPSSPPALRSQAAVQLAWAASATGKWAECERSLAAIDGADDDIARVRALSAAQRSTDAESMARRLIGRSSTTVPGLVECGLLLLRAGEVEDAELAVAFATDRDPHDPGARSLALLIGRLGAGNLGAGDGDDPRVGILRRALADVPMPRSVLRAVLGGTAAELDGAPTPDELDLPYGELFAMLGADSDATSPAGFGTWSEAAPNDLRLARYAVIRSLRARDGERALARIEAARAALGGEALSREKEAALRLVPGRGPEADEIRDARLAHETLGIDATIERAATLIRDGDVAQANATLESAWPAWVELDPFQNATILGIKASVIARLAESGSPPDALESGLTLETLDTLQGLGIESPWTIWVDRLFLEGYVSGKPAAEIAAMVLEAAEGNEENLEIGAARALTGLELAGRETDAWEAFLRVGGGEVPITTRRLMLGRTIFGVARDASVPTIVRTLELIGELGLTAEALELLSSAAALDPESTDAELAGELSYRMASLCLVRGRQLEAEAAYQIALGHDPRHAMANNDYGYLLADEDRELGRALEMVDLANRLRPDNPNITDSVGWARYKLGMLEGEDGAIRWLERAIELDPDGENTTPRDHLGDALWRAGRPDEARDLWLEGEALGLALVRRLRTQGNSGEAISASLKELERIRAKIRALGADEDPPVAPWFPGDANNDTAAPDPERAPGDG